MASDLHSLLLNGLVSMVVLLGVAQAQVQPVTDPIEVGAFRSISRHWNLTSKISWNLSEPCSGTALDTSTIDDTRYDPAIKCDCSANNATTCHITQMKVYALSVTGTIPEALANLTSLENLNLAQNYLTGPLPAFIGNLTSMKYLTFGINALSGTVPKELGNMKNLKVLSFGHNNFSGSLPPELGKLDNLEELYINSAGLSGPIPSTFVNLKKLRVIWAQDNQFAGKIPDFISNWTNITTLRLESSFSQGPIPIRFSDLTAMNDLRISDVSNGSTSLSFIKNMTLLNILVLRNIMISESITLDFASYKKMQHLDLSFNKLTGEIPTSLFLMDSLSYLYLGDNGLSGSIPPKKSPSLLNIDLSYNNLSGSFPSWLGETNLRINLVGNSFGVDDSNNRALPSGLICLQKGFSCNRGKPVYSSFAIKCGGEEITSSSGLVFERDNMDLGAASYYVVETRRWAVSSHGNFFSNNNPQYLQNTSSRITNTSDPKLFQTVRLSPVSLRYYGLGLENGNYTVKLYFSELAFPNFPDWRKVGKRIFDIYLQGNLVMKDFDIRKQAGGVSFKAISVNFTASISENFLDIHLYWAGKGTCCVPVQGTYGPSISAISVSPDFVPTVCNQPPGMCSTKKVKAWIVGGILAAAVVVLVVPLLIVFALRRRKRKLVLASAIQGLSGMGAKPEMFSYADLKAATNDFNVANKLGEGGFGPVFKGTLSDGRVVAVKQLSVESHQGKDQFLAEIATVSAVEHRNLVKLHGCCLHGDKYLLVYEYLENGSLDQSLFGNRRLKLNWPSRFNICLGTARGLAYLHEQSSLRIVHRDVKASNILLDAEHNPKVSDFGMARFYEDNKSHLSTRVAGTVGYLAPEYAMRGHLTEKVDVFAFGVLALEIISGRPNEDSTMNQNQIYLLEWAWDLHENNMHLKLLDPTLIMFDEVEAERVVRVALLCTQASPTLRPRMSRVIAMLSGDVDPSPITSKPAYLTDWQFKDVSSMITTDASTSTMATSTTGAASPYSSEHPMVGQGLPRST